MLWTKSRARGVSAEAEAAPPRTDIEQDLRGENAPRSTTTSGGHMGTRERTLRRHDDDVHGGNRETNIHDIDSVR